MLMYKKISNFMHGFKSAILAKLKNVPFFYINGDVIYGKTLFKKLEKTANFDLVN
jgi:hypothetical protein